MSSSGEADGQQPVYEFEPAGWIDLTEACHHYEGKHEVPWDIQKYGRMSKYTEFQLTCS